MRKPRIKAKSGQPGLYHCMSRIVGGEYIFRDLEKEIFVSQMWKLADFCGIGILNYCVMSNHYHQLLEVPGTVQLDDPGLLQRVAAYYGKDSKKYLHLEQALSQGEEVAGRARHTYLRRMGDLSAFQKLLKQRFSVWYNKRNNRKGTLWMERFKGVLVEDTIEGRMAVSAYIDLNPVRASMVADPKDYRSCGYAAALAGHTRCRDGLMRVMAMDTWRETAAAYRVSVLFRGQYEASGKSGTIDRSLLLKTLETKGKLSAPELLCLRIRYLTDGLVLGSEAFVEEVFQRYRGHFGKRSRPGGRPVEASPWQTLRIIQNLRQPVYA